MTPPQEVNVGCGTRKRAQDYGGRCDCITNDGPSEEMADGTGHSPPYAVSEAPVNQIGRKKCDPGQKEAKVVKSPKPLKMGVNSPVTSRIYA